MPSNVQIDLYLTSTIHQGQLIPRCYRGSSDRKLLRGRSSTTPLAQVTGAL
jgi:hypothetical protein